MWRRGRAPPLFSGLQRTRSSVRSTRTATRSSRPQSSPLCSKPTATQQRWRRRSGPSSTQTRTCAGWPRPVDPGFSFCCLTPCCLLLLPHALLPARRTAAGSRPDRYWLPQGEVSFDDWRRGFFSSSFCCIKQPAGEDFSDLFASQAVGCKIKETAERGITCEQLGRVEAHIKRRCKAEGWTNWAGKTLGPEEVSLYEAAQYVIKPVTYVKEVSYVELIATGAQVPLYFVSHCAPDELSPSRPPPPRSRPVPSRSPPQGGASPSSTLSSASSGTRRTANSMRARHTGSARVRVGSGLDPSTSKWVPLPAAASHRWIDVYRPQTRTTSGSSTRRSQDRSKRRPSARQWRSRAAR